jgi:hypothetical protein
MNDIDMDPRTAEFVEAASDMLRLSARIRPELKRWDHQVFAAEGLHMLYGSTITGIDTAAAVETASKQEGIQ